MDKLFLSLTILFAGFLYVTLSQENQDGWESWINISVCNAPPCNCSKKDRVVKQNECEPGKVLQIRGCTSDTCRYHDNTGTIRENECYNLNRFCPGWSGWGLSEKCKCKENSTAGTWTLQRTCTNPPPVIEGSKCRINDEEEALSDEKEVTCNCSKDDDDDSEETTTQLTTTPGIRYCKCPNATIPLYPDEDDEEGMGKNESDDYGVISVDWSKRTTKSTTSKVSPTPDPYGLNLDYGDYGGEKLCICTGNETMSSPNETMSNANETMSNANETMSSTNETMSNANETYAVW